MHRLTKLIVAFSLFISLALSLGGYSTVHANNQKEDTGSKATTTAYEYTVRPNDNLSILVRRSLQLYAQAKGISLSPAAAMYSETLVTQRMGNPSLETNQRVQIPFNLLEEFIASSKALSEKQVAAWNSYAQSANFDLGSVVPTNADDVKRTLDPKTSSTKTPDQEQTTQKEQEKSQSEGTNKASKDTENKDKWWWVVLLAIIVVSTSFLYSRRPPSK